MIFLKSILVVLLIIAAAKLPCGVFAVMRHRRFGDGKVTLLLGWFLIAESVMVFSLFFALVLVIWMVP